MRNSRIKCQLQGTDSLRYVDPLTGIAYDASGSVMCKHLKWVEGHNVFMSAGRSCYVPVQEAPTPDPKSDGVNSAPRADGNPKSAQGQKKYSLRLIPLPAQVALNAAFSDGVVKYGAANWRKSGVAASVYVDAALRHLMQWFDGGEEVAEDSKVHHLGHAMACLAIILDAQHQGTLKDDRPTPCNHVTALLTKDNSNV